MNNTKLRTLAVDLYSIANRHVGVGEFSFCFGQELARRADELTDKGLELTFFVPQGERNVFGEGIRYIEVNKWTRPFYRMGIRRFDLFHELHQYGFLKRISSAGCNLMTVHDINFIYEKTPNKVLRYSKNFARKIARTDYLVFISHFVEEDVKKHFRIDKPTVVIHNGVADLTVVDQTTPVSLPTSDYLLHVSSLLPKKNPELMIRMMQFLPSERLVLVGNWKGEHGERYRSLIRQLGLTNVYPLDHVSEAMKVALYKNCKAFVFPSLCEGFGLPPIEAMRFGKPVFLSRLTSLPEVGGETAFYFDELEPEKMAETIARRLVDPSIDAEQIRRWSLQFSWKRSIDHYVNLYFQLLGLPITTRL